MNQTLIVALGAAVDGTDTDRTADQPAARARRGARAPSRACAHCHVTLDPTRSIFAANYSWNYHDQLDTTWSGQPGEFIFQGVVQPVTSMADFGSTLAAHPFFAAAWVEKLCYYANSGPCDAADPEFQRLVSLFQSSSYSWNTLVAELFSSPLTTNADADRDDDRARRGGRGLAPRSPLRGARQPARAHRRLRPRRRPPRSR